MGPRGDRRGRGHLVASPDGRRTPRRHRGGVMDRGYIERNDASRARLRALLERLTDEDLGRKVGDWTVGMSLAHLAFWDRFGQLRWIETVASGRDLPVQVGSPLTDLINDTSLDLWS